MDERKPVPNELLARIKLVKNKRARFVLDKIVKNGMVSTLEIQKKGYDHPPRAVMDAKDLGFAIKRVQARRNDGQTIAAYQFEDAELDANKTGRVLVPKKDRQALIADKGAKCNMCGCETNLQIASHSWLLANLRKTKRTRTKSSMALVIAENRGRVNTVRIG